jgi:hypothetical protein
MATPNLSLQEPANNTLNGTWDVAVNANSTTLDNALGAAATLNATGLTGVQALTLAQYSCATLVVTGAPAGNVTYQLPAGVSRFLFVNNTTTGAFSVSFASASGGAVVAVPQGASATVVIDPTRGARLGNTIATGAGGAANQVQVNAGGALAGAPGLVYNPATSGLAVGGPLAVSGPVALSGAVTTPLVVQASAATITAVLAFQTAAMPIDCSKSNVFRCTLTTNMTSPPVLSNMADGQTINVLLQQDATGNRTALWPANFKWVNGTPGVLSTAPNAADLLVLTYFASLNAWLAALLRGFA